MNDAPMNPTVESSRSRHKLKRRHIYLVSSVIALAAFVTYLTDYASQDVALFGFCSLGVFTTILAMAAFFKAYSKD